MTKPFSNAPGQVTSSITGAMADATFRLTLLLAIVAIILPNAFALLDMQVPGFGLLLEFGVFVRIALAVGLLFWGVFSLLRPTSKWTRFQGMLLAFTFLAAAIVYPLQANKLQPLQKAEKVYTAPLLVASLNVNVDNTKMREAAQWAVENRPDVMAFVEVSEHQLVELRKSLSHIYKHEYKSVTEGVFGMAVFSYYPMTGAQFFNDDGMGQPMFMGKLNWDVEPVWVGVVHPMPPIMPADLAKRDLHIRALAQAMDGPAVLMGDFNATRYSTLLTALGEKFAYAPKSPIYTVTPYLLDIDHVLQSKAHFLQTESNAVPVDGSDHKLVWSMSILKDRNQPK